ncbi:MAG TPA: Gfo/Idh/MocA family oxidoreductase [Planctomycetota bacterium]|nr:Gfo/Idh/MocA family oxidoreductase [Planctomycetota bacterium]
MIRVGLVGMGFMGWIHWLAYRASRGIEVTALCTREPHRLAGDWREIRGNFGPPGEMVDVSRLDKYQQIEAMLEDPTVDLVDLCLPPHLHAEVSIRALKAGKHVFCEKPMALTTADGERMIEAARQAGRQLFVGHVLPYFPEYAHARQVIAEGRHGRLLGGSFKRTISDPTWLKDFYDPARIGGPLLDLHVHDAHLIRLLFGMPRSVFSRGRMRGEVVEYVQTAFSFPDPSLVVSAEGGVVRPQGRSFTHSFEIHLEKATLQYEFAIFDGNPRLILPLTICEEGGRVLQPSLGDGDPIRAFEAEIAGVVRSLETGRPSPLLSGDLARDAVMICQKETQSVQEGRAAALTP